MQTEFFCDKETLSVQCAHWPPPPKGEARRGEVRTWLSLWESWHGVSRD